MYSRTFLAMILLVLFCTASFAGATDVVLKTPVPEKVNECPYLIGIPPVQNTDFAMASFGSVGI